MAATARADERWLAGHALFADVSAAALAQLAQQLQIHRFAAGELILRAGAPSAALYGLIAGAVRVDVGAGGRRVLLVPPQCFGELSALSGDPVSASVVADRDTTVWALSAQLLFDALAQESAFFRNLATLLGQRLRERTRRTLARRPRVVLVAGREPADHALLTALFNGLCHYVPGSARHGTTPGDLAPSLQRLYQWRNDGPGGAVLLLDGSLADCAPLLAELDADDALLHADGEPLPDTPASVVAWQRGTPGGPRGGPRDGPRGGMSATGRWCHTLPPDEIDAAAAAVDWPGSRCAAVDHLVRRLTGREVGLAMSVGAAAGLAHLGVLEVLEGDGLPIDFLCGSSMGGAVALAFARHGSARAAIELILDLVADFARAKGFQWLPRGSLLSAARVVTIAETLYGDASFAQLRRPVAVVAADLALGKRVVLDTGSVALAARATAAIPGLFAPVRRGDAVLVDGGVVTRVPVDLLAARGCGFKLAALVRPNYADAADAAQAADRLEARLARPLGLRAAMGGAWRLLGWWDSASQAERADLSLTIPIPVGEGFNFAAAQAMIDCGRHAAQQRLPQIRSALQQVLAPGVP